MKSNNDVKGSTFLKNLSTIFRYLKDCNTNNLWTIFLAPVPKKITTKCLIQNNFSSSAVICHNNLFNLNPYLISVDFIILKIKYSLCYWYISSVSSFFASVYTDKCTTEWGSDLAQRGRNKVGHSTMAVYSNRPPSWNVATVHLRP